VDIGTHVFLPKAWRLNDDRLLKPMTAKKDKECVVAVEESS